jgi:hypothetical protein
LTTIEAHDRLASGSLNHRNEALSVVAASKSKQIKHLQLSLTAHDVLYIPLSLYSSQTPFDNYIPDSHWTCQTQARKKHKIKSQRETRGSSKQSPCQKSSNAQNATPMLM